jgi:hypothetical protein
MDEDGTTALPMGNVVMTTEIRISIEQDAISERSTQALRDRNGSMA